MSQYSERVSELLEDRNWKETADLISTYLEDNAYPKEEMPTAAYNLVVCYLKQKNPALSQSALNKYKELLSPEDLNELQDSIYKLPSKLKSNEVQGLAWFKSDTKMDNVIGLSKLKEMIRERIISVISHVELYKSYGVKLNEGFILYGPPGTGKTLMARAIGGETGVRMLIGNIHELVSKYQGESSKNLHAIFSQARDGNPAIIFFDEIDSLATDRNASNVSSTGGEDRRIIDTLLTELDGIGKDNQGIYVIGATNRPWELDSAFTRSGRFNTFLYVPPPSTKERELMFRYYVSKLKAGKIDYRKLAYMTFGMSPADIEKICDNATKHTLGLITKGKIKERAITTRDLVNTIRKMPAAPLIKEYEKALEKMREMTSAERSQYKDFIKDIIFFTQKGKQKARLYRLIAKVA